MDRSDFDVFLIIIFYCLKSGNTLVYLIEHLHFLSKNHAIYEENKFITIFITKNYFLNEYIAIKIVKLEFIVTIQFYIRKKRDNESRKKTKRYLYEICPKSN